MRSRQRTAQVCGALKVAAVIKVVCEAGKANPRYTRTENNDTNDTEREREREREREYSAAKELHSEIHTYHCIDCRSKASELLI